MDWPALFAGKVLDWLWLIFTAVIAYVWRLEASMHKHRTRIELLESEMQNRVSNAQQLSAGIEKVAGLVETHRNESATRMSELRRELREDMKLIIEMYRESDR